MANPSPTNVHAGPQGDAVARLSSIRRALARAEACAGGPAPDLNERSTQVVGAAAAGLEALSRVDDSAAGRELVDQIRRELAEISNLVLR